MQKNPTKTDISLWLTFPIVILLAIAAGAGLFSSGLYRDDASLTAQALGQDLITLVVALPALVICAVLAARGSQRARLVWLGLLVYVAYTYASYAFGIQWNPMFLVYVALLGCSTYALIAGLLAVDRSRLQASFTDRTPAKAVSIFLMVIAAVFYLMWLSEAGPASLTGITPESIQQDGTPTNVIHVLDMGLLLPALVIAAVSLWRKQPMGYALASAFLVNLAFLALAILSMTVFQARAGEPAPMPMVIVFVALFALSVGMLVWHLKNLRAAPQASVVAPGIANIIY